MIITALDISNFRNITAATLTISPRINVFLGKNGSGKTSLLESIFLLTHGRSFRTLKINRVIRHECERLVVRGHLSEDKQQQPPLVIATERTLEGKARFKMGPQYLSTPAELTRQYPLLLINPDSYRILELGPKYRRQFLDWGLFHVEQSFYGLWQRYNRVLKQRNGCLRQQASQMSLKAWDQEFIAVSEAIDGLRQGYLQAYQQAFEGILRDLLPNMPVSLHYQRGWAQKGDLKELLHQSLARDYELGYTTYGPHRADLLIKLGAHQAHETLSRGQQKLLLFALRLAQGALLRTLAGKTCGYLIDDLPAELDQRHQRIVMDFLQKQGFQVLLTGLDEQPFLPILENAPNKVFHVEHGVIQEVEALALSS
jgi:DNA replication and repair protein RecF